MEGKIVWMFIACASTFMAGILFERMKAKRFVVNIIKGCMFDDRTENRHKASVVSVMSGFLSSYYGDNTLWKMMKIVEEQIEMEKKHNKDLAEVQKNVDKLDDLIDEAERKLTLTKK